MGRVVYRHDRGRDSRETDLSYRIIWYRIVPVRYCTYLPGVKCVCNFFLPFLFFSLFSSFSFLFSLLALLNKKSFFISFQFFPFFPVIAATTTSTTPLSGICKRHLALTNGVLGVYGGRSKERTTRKGRGRKERKGRAILVRCGLESAF